MNISVDPNASVYFDMYRWGLKRVDLSKIEDACKTVGKFLRKKDVENYWRGYYKSAPESERNIFKLSGREHVDKLDMPLDSWSIHPYINQPEIEDRWVPCNRDNKPMVRWGQETMSLSDAEAWPGGTYVAENLRYTRFIVIDCDGDHDENRLDFETVGHLWKYQEMTHTMVKPKFVWEYPGYEDTRLEVPASFHLTFVTDRVIPTIHVPEAHVDILGNQNNQLRYLKRKLWNHRYPMMLTEEIWDDIRTYCKQRKERHVQSLGLYQRSLQEVVQQKRLGT